MNRLLNYLTEQQDSAPLVLSFALFGAGMVLAIIYLTRELIKDGKQLKEGGEARTPEREEGR